MMGSSVERKKDGGKLQFFFAGFTQAAGVRIYAFEGRVDARRIGCTVQVDLALIAGYGIRIQDLPLLCRDFLQQREQPDEAGALVFTEQRMRSHAEKLAMARKEAEQRKKPPKHLARPHVDTGWRLPLR